MNTLLTFWWFEDQDHVDHILASKEAHPYVCRGLIKKVKSMNFVPYKGGGSAYYRITEKGKRVRDEEKALLAIKDLG
jgi:hypothetical protein